MSKPPSQTTSHEVPSIRFNGYEDNWSEKQLGDICNFLKGNGISKDEIDVSGVNKCIRYGELYTEYSEIIKTAKSKTNVNKSNSVESKENDIIIPSSGETAIDIATASCVKEAGVLLGGDLNIIRLNKDCNGEFIAYYLSNFANRSIARLAQGNAVVHLYATHLKSLKIKLPSLSEQQKISTFLSSIDEWIENLRLQKESLEKYKKGMIQKLFSQQIRFKNENGKVYPEWEQKRLGEFLISELREVSKPTQNYKSIGIRSHFKGTFRRLESDPNKIAMDKLYQVKENDLIVNITFAWEGAVAIVKKEDEGGLVSHRFPTHTFNKDITTPDFFKHIFPTKRFKYILENISPGGAGRNRVLNRKDFLKIEVSLPSISEQRKIADFINAIDGRVSLKAKQIIYAQQWKKGLMQKMFI